MRVLSNLMSSPRRQVLFASALASVLCLVLGASYFLFVRKPYEVLFANLRPGDAATIVAELDKKKQPYRLENGGATILVPADKVDATRLSIAGQDLPLKGMVGFEIFNKSDMGLTEFAQKINYQRALQGELARTIMSIDGVDTARVHLSLPEPSIFRDDRRPPKASVALLMRPGAQLSPADVRGIQRLVGAAVPDLDASNVVVIDDKGAVISSEAPSGQAAEPQAGQQGAIEQYYVTKVRQALAKSLPRDAFQVTVAVASAKTSQSNGQGDVTDAPSSTAGFDAWTPDDRKFLLNVSVATSTPLSARLKEEVRAAVDDAIGFDPALGDAVSITRADPVTAEPTPEPGLKAVERASAEKPRQSLQLPSAQLSPSGFWLAILAPVLVVLGGVLALLLRRRGAPQRLSDAERSAYARRLSELLSGEDSDVVRRV